MFRIARALRVELRDLVQTRTENTGDELDTLLGDIVNLLKGRATLADLRFLREAIRAAMKVYAADTDTPGT